MTKPSLQDLLVEIRTQHVYARHAVEKMGKLIGQITDLTPVPLSLSHPSDGRPKSLVRWIEYLKANGPALRKEVAAGTGCNLSTSATPHVRKWQEHMEAWEDDQLPADTVLTVPLQQNGVMGRPQAIYFLWSQRYDLRSKYGMGPTAPVTIPGGPVALTGVVGPTDFNYMPEGYPTEGWQQATETEGRFIWGEPGNSVDWPSPDDVESGDADG